MIKIGFDAKRAFLNGTGLGNYSRWLLQSLVVYQPQYRYHLYTPKVKPNAWLAALRALPGIQIHLSHFFMPGAWWRSWGMVKDLQRDDIKLYHGLSHELPMHIADSGIASVVTVHDIIALRFPEYFGWLNCRIYVSKLKYACQVADTIVAISKNTKTDLIKYLQIDADKISVIYQNCDPAFARPCPANQKQALRHKYHLPERYLLTVGTIEERKNLLLAVKALKEVQQPVQLVVIGRPTPYLQQVNAYLQSEQLGNRVLFLHQVPFADLPGLYQMATLFIYPSRYEGFGIPILEALNAGVPVIAASGSCLEEAGGPESMYVDPDDAPDLAKKISFLLEDASLRQHMADEGRKYAAGFSDEILAGQMIHLYRKTLQNHA